jgi:hypothetical protein
MEETGEAYLLTGDARQRRTPRSADLQSALRERPPVMNALEPDRSTSYQTHAKSRSQTQPSPKALAGRAGAPSPHGHRQFLNRLNGYNVLTFLTLLTISPFHLSTFPPFHVLTIQPFNLSTTVA